MQETVLRIRISGKIVTKCKEEGLYLFTFENGETHEACINADTQELYPRIRKGTHIVMTYDSTDSFVTLGI